MQKKWEDGRLEVFLEQASRSYITKEGMDTVEIVPLVTAAVVLDQLEKAW